MYLRFIVVLFTKNHNNSFTSGVYCHLTQGRVVTAIYTEHHVNVRGSDNEEAHFLLYLFLKRLQLTQTREYC